MRRSFTAAILATTLCSGVAFAQTRTQGWQSLAELNMGAAPTGSQHYTSTWVSDGFQVGSGIAGVNMTWNEGNNPGQEFQWLWFGYGQSQEGRGFDVGIGRNNSQQRTVAELSEDGSYNGWQSPALYREMSFVFSHDLRPNNANAFWWMGPKTIIYSEPRWQDKPGTDATRLQDEFECYIVVNASLTREALATRLGLTYIGSAEFGPPGNKQLYHHYTDELPLGNSTIHQIWTIKDVYTNQVSVPVNDIQRDWKDRDRPNWLPGIGITNKLVPWDYYNLGWKVNLETSGKFDYTGQTGWGNFAGVRIPSNDF